MSVEQLSPEELAELTTRGLLYIKLGVSFVRATKAWATYVLRGPFSTFPEVDGLDVVEPPPRPIRKQLLGGLVPLAPREEGLPPAAE